MLLQAVPEAGRAGGVRSDSNDAAQLRFGWRRLRFCSLRHLRQRFEDQASDVNGEVQLGSHLGDGAHRQKRVTAKVEKVVGRAYAINAQDPFPNSCDRLLDG